MKKLPMLFAAVIATAVLSAFTTKEPTTSYFRDTNGVFHEIEGPGNCSNDQYNCEYIWTGAVNNDPQEEGNYQAVGEDGKVFEPLKP